MDDLVSMLTWIDMGWTQNPGHGSLSFHMIMYVTIPNYIDHLLHWPIFTNHHMIVHNFIFINQHHPHVLPHQMCA